MGNLIGFDANTVEPDVGFEPLPAGKYLTVITASEKKPTKSENGAYLELTFEVMEGSFNGRKLWERLVLEHPNPMTVKIAKAKLSAICRAVGVLQPMDSVELHNLPIVLNIGCRKRADTGEIENEIKGFSKKEAAMGKPAQSLNATPPWRR